MSLFLACANPSVRFLKDRPRFLVLSNRSSAFFHYNTATGGAWQGTIGRLQADVGLRDGLTADQLIWPGMKPADDELVGQDAKYATNPLRKGWQVIDAKHLRLVWNDFEPRRETNHRGFSLARRFHGWD